MTGVAVVGVSAKASGTIGMAVEASTSRLVEYRVTGAVAGGALGQRRSSTRRALGGTCLAQPCRVHVEARVALAVH